MTVGKRPVTLTWTNKELTYNGNAQAPTVTVGNVCSGDTCNAVLTTDSPKTDSNAKAGIASYTATVASLTNTTNYQLPENGTTSSFTIGQRPVTVTASNQTVELNDGIVTSLSANPAPVSMSGAVDGHTLQSVTLTPNSTAAVTTNGIITPSEIVIQDAGGEVVTGNYAITPANGVLTVTIGQLTIVTDPTAGAITYGQTLANSGFTGGVVKDKHDNTVEGSFSWKTPSTKPSFSDSNETPYDLVFTPTDTTNYSPTNGTLTLTVNPKPVIIAWDDTELTYDGTAQKPTATVDNLEDGDEVDVTVSGEQTDSNAKAGTANYTATASALGGTGAGNYTLDNGTNLTQTFTIVQKSINGAAVELNMPADLVYDGAQKTVTVKSVTLTDGSTQTELDEDTEYTVSGDLIGTETGGYTVTVTGTGNYKDSAEGNWAITIAPVTIDTLPTAADITYGQTLADSTLTGGVVKLGENTVEGSFAWKTGDTQPAVADSGKTLYPVVFTPKDKKNYNPVEGEVTLEVLPAASVPATVTANNRTYDGTEKPLVTVDESTLAHGKMRYTTGTEAEPAGTYTAEIPAEKKMGTYYVWYMVEGDTNYDGFEPDAPVKVTIGKKEATIAADNKSKAYRETDPALTATITGEVSGDKLEYTLGREEGDNVGTYAIKVTLKEGSTVNANYSIKTTDGEFTISEIGKDDLADALEDAKKYYEEIKEDHPEIAKELKKAIDEAEKTAEDPNVKKDKIAEETEKLKKALEQAKKDVQDEEGKEAADKKRRRRIP